MRPYPNSTFRHGFEARELKDLFEVGSRMSAPVLNGAARRAVEVLVAGMGDDEKVLGALASEVTITMAPRGA